MKKVIIGSINPVKIEATKEVFLKVFAGEEFEFIGYKASSGVSEQPIGTEETKKGSLNRAEECIKNYPEADFFVGLEGGLEEIAEKYWVSAWMCVMDKNSNVGFGRSGAFLLPPKISSLIKQGMELGEANDIIFSDTNSKHKGGAVGALTNNLIERKNFYVQALIFALIPFIKTELYN